MQMPKEINSKTELFRGVHFEDFVYFLMYFLIFYLFQNLVHPMLVIFYYIYNAFIGMWLFAPSKSPNRKIFHLLLYRLHRRRNVNCYLPEVGKKGEIFYE